jgi:hypothetical protein
MTSEFKKLAKICDSAVVRTDSDGTVIDLIFRVNGPGMRRLPIITEGRIITQYGDVHVSYPVKAVTTVYGGDRPVSCFGHISCCRFNEAWQTMVACVKPSDVVGVRWVLGNNSELLNERQLHFDSCEITLSRGKQLLHFPVEQRVSLQNTARMAQI